jgi:hypothetical protein
MLESIEAGILVTIDCIVLWQVTLAPASTKHYQDLLFSSILHTV